MVCQQSFVCTNCLADYQVHDVWKVSDISLNYSTLADQLEENHKSAIADTEAHFMRIKACIEGIKSRVALFESDMHLLFLSILKSQNSIRAKGEACVSSQLLKLESQLSQGLPLPSDTMKACHDIGIKYNLSNANSWHVVQSTSTEEMSDQRSQITFPTVSLGKCGRLHCELEPCPKWNGTAGSEFTFVVRISDRQGRKLSQLQSTLTQVKAVLKEGESSSVEVLTTESSYALVKVHVAQPCERVVVSVTINNSHTLLTPPIKFSAMPIVLPSLVWTDASSSVFPISGHASASFQNKIYVTGGISNGKPVGMGSVFNAICLEWTETLPMPAPRSNHGLVECNGHLWMMGGRFQGKCSGSMEKYDILKCSWEKAPSMPECATDFAAISHKGCIYIIGGSSSPADTLIFDCHSSKWDRLSAKMRWFAQINEFYILECCILNFVGFLFFSLCLSLLLLDQAPKIN
jgi:hypothetical protein